MHTQEDFNRFVIKVAPEGSLQGFHIPYTEDLISMEPCTLWAKFLLEEREEAAFSGPQIRAYMGQQPGALNSKRAMQPLLETGLGNEATFQCGIRMANASWLPFDEVAFTEDMLFSAAWSVQHRQSLREQRREFGSVLAEMARMLQPLQRQLKRCAVPHQHKLVDINVVLAITTVCLIMWQANMLPTRLLQGHNLASTITATGIFGEVQEEKPSMTREELLGSNHRQSLSEAKQTRMDRHTDFLFPSYLEEEAREWSTQCCSSKESLRCFLMDGAQRQPSSSSRRRAN